MSSSWRPARRARRARAEDVVGSEAVTWTALLDWLGRHGRVEQVGTGTMRVHEDGGTTFDVHLTPPRWHEHVVDAELGVRHDRGVDASQPGDGIHLALLEVEEAVTARWDDERHVVLDGHRVVPSVRAALPPVPGHVLEGTDLRDLPDLRDGPAGWLVVGADEERALPVDRPAVVRPGRGPGRWRSRR